MRYFFGGWAPPLGIEYVVDHVAAFVVTVITAVALLVIIATRSLAAREAKGREGAFYGLVLLVLTGLTGIVVTGDLFNLFVFLEVASLASYALVFMGGRAGMIAGFRYLMLGSIGGALYLLGVGFIYFATGTLNMADVSAILTSGESSRAVQAGAAFIFTGLGLKMGLVPLHLWLPDAYTHAPSSVNSLIAPIMTKVAAYAMLRMFLSVFPAGYLEDAVPVATALLVLGVIGTVFGSVAAMAQTDLRRMLAYSSVSQLAMIAVGIGLATPLGLVAALLHVMNHAVMKAALFLTAASMRLSADLTDVEQLTGLGHRMPVTMGVFALGAVSMVGIPPTAGFFSKWYLAQAGIESGQWAVVVVVLASSLLSAVYFFRVLERVYLRPVPADSEPGSSHASENTQDEHLPAIGGAAADRAIVKESPLHMLVPMAILGLATVLLGVFNVAIVTKVLEPGV